MVGHSPKWGVAECGDSDDHSLDAIFDVPANQRRRYALVCLTDHTQAIALADLAEDIAVCENEGPITGIPKEEVQTICTSLYHNHIPKMVDVGVVKYDQDRDLARVSDTADRAERILSLAAIGEGGRR